MKQYLIFIFIVCAGCSLRKQINLDVIAKSKYKAFKYVSYRPGEMDYSYCDSASQIVDLKLEKINQNKRLIVVCLAVDNTYVRAQEKSRFFKYSQIDMFGQVTFCGWRDNYMKTNRRGDVISNYPKVGSSGKCQNFSIYQYKHE